MIEKYNFMFRETLHCTLREAHLLYQEYAKEHLDFLLSMELFPSPSLLL
jgi:hypothetical protein